MLFATKKRNGQSKVNFKENETATKLRGGYYTDPEIAAFLLKWVMRVSPRAILEPSCGDGVFLRALSNLSTGNVESVVGFEIDREEASKARVAARYLPGVTVDIHARDFLGWSLINLTRDVRFDGVVGNPPFIRYQYLDNTLQNISQKIFQVFHLPFTRHTNAWVPFVIASLALLRPNGRLAMVLPAELLHVLHAESLRQFLARECSRLLIFDPQEIWFEGTLQGAVLLLAEKKPEPKATFKGLAIIPTRQRDFLQCDPEAFFDNATYTNSETTEGKWMLALLSDAERNLIRSAKTNQHIQAFASVADVAVGIVTGANKFFLVSDSVVNEFGLENWAYPMFGRSEHVPGVIYDKATVRRNQRLGMPTNFIWFAGEKLSELPASVQKYIKSGEAEGLHKRYKCRIREPWYSVPSVYATSVGMLKRSHDFPRLVLNKVGAYTTDTAYRVNPKLIDGSSLVFSFVNSLTALTAELEGRHYGGGVLELVPSEIRKLLIPIVKANGKTVRSLDEALRCGLPPDALLAAQDRVILREVGFGRSDCADLLGAWWRLRSRRQRLIALPLSEGEDDEAN